MSGERRVAVVSGGSRGLGEAIVADLLGSGAVVATFSRSATPWIERCRAADTDGSSFHWEAIDGGDFPRLGEFVRGVVRRFGPIDVLVNNMATISDGLLALSRATRRPPPGVDEPGSGDPADPRLPEGHARARLGLDRQYLIGQRAARPCGRLGLRRNEGRPDRIDQKPGGRAGARAAFASIAWRQATFRAK